MFSKRCILTNVELTAENDSKAHVVPSALGGRLKPKGILCEGANAEINDKIDLPLVRGFQPIMTLLGGSRDRGENPAVKMTDESGRIYSVSFGRPLAPVKPELKIDEAENRIEVRASARTPKELRTRLAEVRKRFPQFDVEEAMQRAEAESVWLSRPLRGQLRIGKGVEFPAAFVAASILPFTTNGRHIPC